MFLKIQLTPCGNLVYDINKAECVNFVNTGCNNAQIFEMPLIYWVEVEERRDLNGKTKIRKGIKES